MHGHWRHRHYFQLSATVPLRRSRHGQPLLRHNGLSGQLLPLVKGPRLGPFLELLLDQVELLDPFNDLGLLLLSHLLLTVLPGAAIFSTAAVPPGWGYLLRREAPLVLVQGRGQVLKLLPVRVSLQQLPTTGPFIEMLPVVFLFTLVSVSDPSVIVLDARLTSYLPLVESCPLLDLEVLFEDALDHLHLELPYFPPLLPSQPILFVDHPVLETDPQQFLPLVLLPLLLQLCPEGAHPHLTPPVVELPDQTLPLVLLNHTHHGLESYLGLDPSDHILQGFILLFPRLQLLLECPHHQLQLLHLLIHKEVDLGKLLVFALLTGHLSHDHS
mmetsp:Transcript_17037/g.16259  ORF Transcript_17037/g.16259 Transcript_17037/m.16259 type:complete len:328 (-) Transcript_17037:2349-3332(-)